MKLYIPFLGLIEKSIQTNFVQRFLEIFRDTKDIHRVLIVIPLTLLISHSLYMKAVPNITLIFFALERQEIIWLILAGFPVLFGYLWAVFSSPFNPGLYGRQIIFIVWTALVHRFSYGLETLGTPYMTAVSLLALTSYLPFAFWGLRPDQLYTKLKEDYDARKTPVSGFQQVPPPAETQSNAA